MLPQRGKSFVASQINYLKTPEGFNLNHAIVATNNTYTQLYTHIVFAVKYRASLISDTWAERLRNYIIAIIQNHGHKLIAINNMPDHMHILIGLNPNQAPSDLVRTVKSDSSEWINKEKLTQGRFQWQEGYGGFTHSRSQVDKVVNYILNQQQQHSKKSFSQEFQQILRSLDIEFDERYIFKQPE